MKTPDCCRRSELCTRRKSMAAGSPNAESRPRRRLSGTIDNRQQKEGDRRTQLEFHGIYFSFFPPALFSGCSFSTVFPVSAAATFITFSNSLLSSFSVRVVALSPVGFWLM